MITSQLFASHFTCPAQEIAGPNLSIKPRFDSEFSLVSDFERLVGNGISPNLGRILREFDSSNGIADLVLVELSNGWEDSISLKDIPPRWAYWVQCLPFPNVFKTDDARRIGGGTQKQAAAFLNLLVELGICEKLGTQSEWRVISRPRPIVDAFYAIEAKKRDWKRALYQASRYRDFSVQSWVLLDHSAIRPAIDHIDRFERLEIGLATISPTGDITAQYVPRPSSPKSQQSFWYANAEAAKRLEQTSYAWR